MTRNLKQKLVKNVRQLVRQSGAIGMELGTWGELVFKVRNSQEAARLEQRLQRDKALMIDKSPTFEGDTWEVRVME